MSFYKSLLGALGPSSSDYSAAFRDQLDAVCRTYTHDVYAAQPDHWLVSGVYPVLTPEPVHPANCRNCGAASFKGSECAYCGSCR